MRALFALLLVGPFVLAFGFINAMCQGWFPTAGACPGPDDWWSVFLSYLIMFCIACWVGGGLTYGLLRARDRVDGPDV